MQSLCLVAAVHLLTAWHLAWVRVVNLASGDRALFTANCWLDSSLASSNNWVQLPAGFDRQAAAAAAVSAPSPAAASPVQQTSGQLGRSGMFGAVSTRDQVSSSTGALKLTKAWLHTSRTGQPGYKVTFTTSNILGAGTAARVFFELIGEHGSSGESPCMAHGRLPTQCCAAHSAGPQNAQGLCCGWLSTNTYMTPEHPAGCGVVDCTAASRVPTCCITQGLKQEILNPSKSLVWRSQHCCNLHAYASGAY